MDAVLVDSGAEDAFSILGSNRLAALEEGHVHEQDKGISQQTVDPSGTIEHMKVSNLERSEGEETLVVVRQSPP